jgi:hypothetical protein
VKFPASKPKQGFGASDPERMPFRNFHAFLFKAHSGRLVRHLWVWEWITDFPDADRAAPIIKRAGSIEPAFFETKTATAPRGRDAFAVSVSARPA